MIRFGIVGTGTIAHKFARDMQYVEEAKLVAVASRTIKKANEFKEEFDLKFAFGSYEDMAKSDKIDAVYIATPHNFHKEHSILFMEHKKHVLCEKPIAVNTNQFEEMVESANDNSVVLMEAMWTKFLPATKKIVEVYDNQTLGKFKCAYLEFGFDVIEENDDSSRLLNPDLAGGSLLDMGVYPVAFLQNITDQKVKSISTETTMHKTGVDVECMIDLVFEDDSKARLVSSFLADRNNPGVIEFEYGTIIADNFWRSEKVTVNGQEFLYPHLGEGFPYEIVSFVKTIQQGKLENDLMSHDVSRKSMELLDRIRDEIGLEYPFEK